MGSLREVDAALSSLFQSFMLLYSSRLCTVGRERARALVVSCPVVSNSPKVRSQNLNLTQSRSSLPATGSEKVLNRKQAQSPCELSLLPSPEEEGEAKEELR